MNQKMANHEPPIFILGNRRSGTTMLRLMLTSHPNIAVPPEGGFLVRLGWKYGNKEFCSSESILKLIDDLFKVDNTEDWQLDRDALTVHLEKLIPCNFSTIISAIYQEYIRQKFPGKVRWGDKTTWYLDYLPMINLYYPDAQFIHLIRDGRDVAASFKAVPHLPSNVEQSAMEWAWCTRTIAQFGRTLAPNRFTEVRYEALVQKPEEELNRICQFVHEPYSIEMLDFAKKNRENTLEPIRHLGWKGLTLEDVTTSQIGKWQEELSTDESQSFLAIAGRMMRNLGYCDEPSDQPLALQIGYKKRYFIYQTKRALSRKLRPWKERLNRK